MVQEATKRDVLLFIAARNLDAKEQDRASAKARATAKVQASSGAKF